MSLILFLVNINIFKWPLITPMFKIIYDMPKLIYLVPKILEN